MTTNGGDLDTREGCGRIMMIYFILLIASLIAVAIILVG